MNPTDQQARRTLQITPAGIVGTVVVLIVAAVCIRLGFWQLDRLAQRRERNAALESRMSLPPVAAANLLRDTAGLTFRSARLSGVFDDARTIVLPGRAFQGVPGVHVLTPLRLDSAPAAVLVNRGWVPAADAATVDYDRLRTTGDTVVTGLLLPFPGHGSSLAAEAAPPTDSAFRRVWYAIDERALREQFPYRLADVQLQLVADVGADGVPHPLPPPPLDEGPHLGYAIQWFSFATIAVVGWIALLLSRERRAHGRD